jgi:hypothetical protein
MDGWMDGRTDGRTDGRMDGWMDGEAFIVGHERANSTCFGILCTKMLIMHLNFIH